MHLSAFDILIFAVFSFGKDFLNSGKQNRLPTLSLQQTVTAELSLQYLNRNVVGGYKHQRAPCKSSADQAFQPLGRLIYIW